MRKFKFHIGNSNDATPYERFIIPTFTVGRVEYQSLEKDFWIDIIFWKWRLCITYSLRG